MKGLYCLDEPSFEMIYGLEERRQIRELVDIYAPPQTVEMLNKNPAILEQAEVIFSGWGHPVFTAELLKHAPNLRMVFYGAGSIRAMVTDAFWERGVRVTTAVQANAIPVVEYTFAQVMLGLKSVWLQARMTREARAFKRIISAGAFGSTVGLISLGAIGRMMVERLKTLDVSILAYDPFVTAYPGVEMVTLPEVFKRSDVVSLHTPWLPETEGLITGALLASMRPNSTFINSARGAVVREAEMIETLRQRPDLTAVIDVTWPEPPAPTSALFDLPNVILTPHMAGAYGNECRRMAQYMIEELKLYQAGEPLRYEVSREAARIMA